ncbi:MAG: hypothetical protein BWY15_00427 [Firmicutes bacterium ADurb.Bin193]|nr:MAG: hypothetical protein BWY15_00427 [Firmicutes bacterium ADurb.Bin193]
MVDVVVATLKKEYPTIHVYDENVPQGFITPSFFVYVISTENERVIGRRYLREYKMAVRYFGSGYTQLRNMAFELFDILEYPEYQGITLHGVKMHYVIEDEVLHFFFDIKVYIDKQMEDVPLMDNMTVSEKLI